MENFGLLAEKELDFELEEKEEVKVTNDPSEVQINACLEELWSKKDFEQIKKDIEDGEVPEIEEKEETVKNIKRLTNVPISLITPNIKQPRIILFDTEKEFKEMVDSIRAKGNILRPITLIPHDKGFMLKDGQRRWTAAIEAGVKEIYSIIEYSIDADSNHIPVSVVELLEDAIVMNLHQKKMSPIEEAKAYADWLELTGKSRKELSMITGKSASDISTVLKFLKLDTEIQLEVMSKKISRILGQHLASYPFGRQREICDVYEQILKSVGGKIPSSNASRWVSRMLAKIARERGIKPLETKKKRKKKLYEVTVLEMNQKAAKRFYSKIRELDSLNDRDLISNNFLARQVVSDIESLMEKMEDVCGNITKRLNVFESYQKIDYQEMG